MLTSKAPISISANNSGDNHRLEKFAARIKALAIGGSGAGAGSTGTGFTAAIAGAGAGVINQIDNTVEAIIETIRRCPSGALSSSLDGVEGEYPLREPAITATKDGPYAVTGSARLLEQDRSQGASTEHYTLCRCGGSRNKPFCDGTHWSIGFKGESR